MKDTGPYHLLAETDAEFAERVKGKDEYLCQWEERVREGVRLEYDQGERLILALFRIAEALEKNNNVPAP